MSNIPCSVGVLTFNSEMTLRRALESVKRAEDIIVCDGGSTDETLDIAREYGARIISQNDKCKNPDGSLNDFSCAKNQLIDEAKHPYLLILDSDEAASEELVEELRRIAKDGTEDGYKIPIRMWWRGRMIEYASNYPGYQYRIVRTDRDVRMIKPVHERPSFSRPLGAASKLTAPWYVFLDDMFVNHYTERNKKYVLRELARNDSVSLRTLFWKIIPANLRPIAGIILKTAWCRLRYPSAVHMPLAVEWGRVYYHCTLILGFSKKVCRL